MTEKNLPENESVKQETHQVTDIEEIEAIAADVAAADLADENKIVGEFRSLRSDVWQQFRRHTGALFGLAFLAIVTLTVAFGPYIYPHDPYSIPKADIDQRKSFVAVDASCPKELDSAPDMLGETMDGYAKGDQVKLCFNMRNNSTGSVTELKLRDLQAGVVDIELDALGPGDEFAAEAIVDMKKDGEKTKLGKFKLSAQPLRNAGPSLTHLAGTDNLGRDVVARVLIGGRVSLAVGFAAMFVGLIIGVIVGILSGYFRKLDGPLMRLTDLFLALPILPLLLVVIALFREPLKESFGETMGIFFLVVVIIGATSWMQTARIVRGDVLAIKEKEFVIAARSLGAKPGRIIKHHVLPNVLSPVTVSASLGVAGAIITESALSFLGLGFPADFPTWGRLLFDAKDYMQINVWRVIWPGVLISATVIAVNFVGDGLRDALDPKLRSASD